MRARSVGRCRRIVAAAGAAAVLVGVGQWRASAAVSAGAVALASGAADGTASDNGAGLVATSATGDRVAFGSSSTNLHGGDTDSLPDIYVRDVATGALFLASTAVDGTKANGPSTSPSISADGSRVAFSSTATNLHPLDTDTTSDVYVKDLATGDVYLASIAADGVTKANFRCNNPSLSSDGRRVAFDAVATNLHPSDTDDQQDVFVKDLATGSIELASASATGEDAEWNSFTPSLSPGGSVVAFVSGATNLHPAATDPLQAHVFVKDLSTAAIVVASMTAAGDIGNDWSQQPRLSGDAGSVAFVSRATNFTAADPDAMDDVYVKDLSTGALTLASTGSGGIKADGPSSAPSLSANGELVGFSSSAANLEPADTDAVSDVFVKDLTTGEVVLASTTGTGAKGDGHSFFPALSSGGGTIAFASSATNLDPVDTNSRSDIYVKTLAPLIRDGDGDGLHDGIDPDTVADRVVAMPDTSFTAPGHRTALLSRLENIEAQIAAGDDAGAIRELENLRRRVDGCDGSALEIADTDDWIRDCDDQRTVRHLIDTIIAGLS